MRIELPEGVQAVRGDRGDPMSKIYDVLTS